MGLVAVASPAASAGFGSGNSQPYPEAFHAKFMKDCSGGSAPAALCECMYQKIQKDLTEAQYIEVEIALQEGRFDAHPYSLRLREHAQSCVAENPA